MSTPADAAPSADITLPTSSSSTTSMSDTTVPAAVTAAADSAVETAAASSASASATAAQHEAKKFLLKHKEKLKMNQYWYSLPTISAMVDECERECQASDKRACFLSTPSIFFSLNDKELQARSKVFDYDEMWAKHPGFVKYDYKRVDEIPKDLYHTFSFIVIDPPFITAEVWADYAAAAKLLLVEGTEEIEIDTALANQYYQLQLRAYESGLKSLNGQVDGTSFAGNIASMLESTIQKLGSAVKSVVGAGDDQKNALPFPIPPRPVPAAATPAAAASSSESAASSEAVSSSSAVPSSPPSPSRSIVTVPRGKLLLSTIPEHEGYLHALLGCYQPLFRPSIPNLIYQYSLYVNYPSEALMKYNPEIDPYEEEDRKKKKEEKFTSKKKSSIAF